MIFTMKSVDPSRLIDVHGLFVKVPQSKTENPNAFCWFFGPPCQFLEILLRKSLVVFSFFFLGGGGHFSAKKLQPFSLPICSNSSVLENWILLAWMFFLGWVRWSFFSPPEKKRPPRNTFKKVCDIRSWTRVTSSFNNLVYFESSWSGLPARRSQAWEVPGLGSLFSGHEKLQGGFPHLPFLPTVSPQQNTVVTAEY